MENFNKTLKLAVLLMTIVNVTAFCSEYNPVAGSKACVVSDDVRITVLTPGLLRLEWSADKKFEDRASLTFINRNTSVPEYKVSRSDGVLEIKTKKLSLKYKIGSGKFTKENLSIDVVSGDFSAVWHFGDLDDKNLLGTTRTLDTCNGDRSFIDKKKVEFCQGIISRIGWCAVDDTNNPLFDNSDWQWVIARPEGNRQDIYFFGYGYDYKTAMKDFVAVAGNIALPPKFAFGVWWSKFWNYDDQQLRDLAEQFTRYDLGLDVMVIDMDWHITSMPAWYNEKGKRKKDQAKESCGWTGFTWNRNYFPDPEKFLAWANENSIRTCMNLHPASGIQPHEEQYNEFAKVMGVDPNTKKYVPFDIVNKDFAKTYMDVLLHPMEKMGIDFWWLDWQQGGTTKIAGVNPTFYLNYVHFSDMERQNKVRPLIFHRWGGLGNHRYQIGFSGDTIITWESLAYQPYFTTNAANVGFGFWSHDIGGHYGGRYGRYGLVGEPNNPELYTRWIQWGVLSPIFRTHATASSEIERRPWAYPMENFQAMRKCYDLRYAIVPYVYTSARQAYDTGVSLCRPLYYDWPRNQEAYEFKNEYMFGDNILVNPVVSPMAKGKKYVMQKTWLPEGRWIEYETGKVFDGNAVIERPFALDEIPMYVKAGAIIPMMPKMKRVDEKPLDPMILAIYPGDKGFFSVYEDAGNDQGYKNDKFAFTDVSFTRSGGKTDITISPAKGGYDNMLTSRGYEIKLVNTFPPKSVSVNGEEIVYCMEPAENSWHYDGEEVATIICLGKQNTNEAVQVSVEQSDADVAKLSGVKGKMNHLHRFVDFVGRAPEPMYEFEPVISTSLAGTKMTYNPSSAAEIVNNFENDYANAVKIIESKSADKKDWRPYLEWLQIN
ncbi:MAG: glycoside hydrolase family 31 protein [Planctomycetaceae bacterium]|nr:glycoside hydrolase family 31 protein [Planctomycetaceae bacterium]